MRTRTLLLALPIVMMATASLAADEYPDIKPGLWSSSQTSSNAQMPPQGGKMCTNNDVAKAFADMAKNPNRPCKVLSHSHTGSTFTSETECNFGGTIKHNKSVMVATGDTAIHTEVQSDDGTSITLDMKYLGACPADMVPGDFVSNNGMRINVLKGMAAGAAPPPPPSH
jgi:hypothetical protein